MVNTYIIENLKEDGSWDNWGSWFSYDGHSAQIAEGKVSELNRSFKYEAHFRVKRIVPYEHYYGLDKPIV